jgi:hypothetical protein
MPRANDRTAYCRQQAAECASAAATTTLLEVKEAYLNMERAWLQLAPDVASNQTIPDRPESMEQEPAPTPNDS